MLFYQFKVDVDYTYTISFSLCNEYSDYDTYLYLYENEDCGTVLASNDDSNCGYMYSYSYGGYSYSYGNNSYYNNSYFSSLLSELDCTGGGECPGFKTTYGAKYCLGVGGYANETGNFELSVDCYAYVTSSPTSVPTSLIVEADLEMKLQVTDRFQAYELNQSVQTAIANSLDGVARSDISDFRVESFAVAGAPTMQPTHSFYPSPSPTQNFSGYLECGVSDIIGETQAAYEENYYHVNTSYAGGLATGIYVSTCSSHTDYDTYLYLYAAGDCGGTIIASNDDTAYSFDYCNNSAIITDDDDDLTSRVYYLEVDAEMYCLGVGGYETAYGTYGLQMGCTNASYSYSYEASPSRKSRKLLAGDPSPSPSTNPALEPTPLPTPQAGISTIGVTVSQTLADTGYPSASQWYTNLKDNFDEAVEDGTLNENLATSCNCSTASVVGSFTNGSLAPRYPTL